MLIYSLLKRQERELVYSFLKARYVGHLNNFFVLLVLNGLSFT